MTQSTTSTSAPRARRWVTATIVVLLVVVLAIDLLLVLRRERYRDEVARLREGMSDVERERTDVLLASGERKTQVMLELIRRQARSDDNLHIAVSVDSGTMHLQRRGERLRDMNVDIGPERVVGAPGDTVRTTRPLGTRAVEALLTEHDSWEVPEHVFQDRGIPAPENRSLGGALGPYAILLSGGTVIYSTPTSGPLADSSYVLPASVRVGVDDMKAIFPNLRVGTRVYFY